jgi:hypothetical protein
MQITFFVSTLLFTSLLYADQKYNPHQNDFNYVAPNTELEYNPYNNKFEYPQ